MPIGHKKRKYNRVDWNLSLLFIIQPVMVNFEDSQCGMWCKDHFRYLHLSYTLISIKMSSWFNTNLKLIYKMNFKGFMVTGAWFNSL